MTPETPARFYPQRMPGHAVEVRCVHVTSDGRVAYKTVGSDEVSVYPLARCHVQDLDRFVAFAQALLDEADTLHVSLDVPAGATTEAAHLWLRSDETLNAMLAEAEVASP